MKHIRSLLLLAGLLLAGTAIAQTPEEILSKMEKALDAVEPKGLYMVVDMKLPIIGTTPSYIYLLGDKSRMETKLLGHRLIEWSDGQTDWEYDETKNEVTISRSPVEGTSEAAENAEMFNGIGEEYDVTLQKETADAWHLRCKKSKANADEHAPKSMDLVVSKATGLPISLKTRISGVTVTIHDLRPGVSEKDVTFRLEDYPGAKVVDER